MVLTYVPMDCTATGSMAMGVGNFTEVTEYCYGVVTEVDSVDEGFGSVDKVDADSVGEG